MTPSADPYPAAGPPAPLLIHRLLDRPLAWATRQRIHYREHVILTYPEFHERVQRLGNALRGLGIGPGDRVGVLDWDSHRYLECFFAVPMLGAVLHTINIRLSADQILFTLRHAGDRILLVHPDFLPLLERLAPQLPEVEHYVLLSDDGQRAATSLPLVDDYEPLLAAASPTSEFAEFEETRIATLFYTTGTTGEPKGVFFSHRQIVLHTLSAGLALAAVPQPVSLSTEDVYLPLTPMFHVHAWGVPYIATLLGLTQVYPGRYEPHHLLQLIDRHRVTFSHCVPTILQMLLHHPASAEVDLSHLKIIIGGSALPPGLVIEARKRGLRVMGGYGMSETCPIISVSHLKTETSPTEEIDPAAYATQVARAGFPVPLVQTAIWTSDDQLAPPVPGQSGELVLRGPWLTPGYYRDEERSQSLWRGGWLHTGDVAHHDAEGYLNITDRLKDVIKIGGEWISSLELENALSQHPAVKEVAVVGLPDAKWDERPHAEVVLRENPPKTVTARELLHFLHDFIDRGVIHKRAILTEIYFVPSVPKTSVGKVDKRAVRELLKTLPKSH